jgi:pyruvate dehydrogenase E1 component beta subunit
MTQLSAGPTTIDQVADAARELSVVQAVREALATALEADPRVMVLGLDVGRLGGVFRATDGLQERFGGQRVVDMPLSEAAIIGSSLGLAVSGMVPVAEIQFLGFAHQAFHQIGPQLGRYRYRSRGRYAAPVTIRAPFGGGIRSAEFHSDAVEAQFAQCPGLKVVMPATPGDAKGLLLAAIRDPDPVLFCEPDRLYRSAKGAVPEHDYEVPLGVARMAREGSDVTLVAWSAAVDLCERAADRLAGDGVSAAVLDLRTLVPLDRETLVRGVAATGRCVVVHEAPLTGGFGAEVVAAVQEGAFYSLDAPVARVAAHDVPFPAGPMEGWNLPDVDRVVSATRQLLRA